MGEMNEAALRSKGREQGRKTSSRGKKQESFSLPFIVSQMEQVEGDQTGQLCGWVAGNPMKGGTTSGQGRSNGLSLD